MNEIRDKLAAAVRELEAARERRDELIMEATRIGMTRREVAEAIGLTPAGVQHVIRQRRRQPH